MSLKGVYTFIKAKLETPEHFALQAEIVRNRNAGKEYRHLIDKLHSLCQTERIVVNNLIPTVGRAAIASHLGNVSPSPSVLYPNYVALGTGTNAPANSDTTLQTETYRKLVASRTSASNVAYITGFFATTDTTGTFRECGLFIDGTASANTGTLLSRVTINITKGGTETLTLDWSLTIS
jgi:hypothetical protein